MKKTEIIERLNSVLTELVHYLDTYNKSKTPEDFADYQTVYEAQEAIKAFERLYDDETPFKDTEGETIRIGDIIDILATNMYDGEVMLKSGVICLETCFFEKPLVEHLTAEDMEFALVHKEYEGVSDGDDLPF